MARDLVDEMAAAEARIFGRPQEEEEYASGWLDLYEPTEEEIDRIREDSRDPAFNLLPPNTKPKTRRQRAEARARRSAASRVRDRSEVDLCQGTRRYLGVACPGCRECEEGDER